MKCNTRVRELKKIATPYSTATYQVQYTVNFNQKGLLRFIIVSEEPISMMFIVNMEAEIICIGIPAIHHLQNKLPVNILKLA